MIDYGNAIHPNCGEYENINDILVTPFFTKEFCNTLCEVSKKLDNKFSFWQQNHTTHSHEGDLYFNQLYFSDISHFLFVDFTKHYSKHILPIIAKEWPVTTIDGWYSPFLVKYDSSNKDTLHLHNDISLITLVVKLNDDYEGGHLEFPRQGYSGKDLPVGYAQIWPSAVTHPHRVTPVTSGMRYSMTSWTWPYSWNDPMGIEYDEKIHGLRVKDV